MENYEKINGKDVLIWILVTGAIVSGILGKWEVTSGCITATILSLFLL